MSIEINDKRFIKDFKKCTFSNYKKTDVKTSLKNSIYNNKIEEACYWTAELVCSALYIDLWEVILFIMSKHIHLGNPKLPIYLSNRYSVFKNIIRNGFMQDELPMRNNKSVRSLFTEIVCILCISPKKPCFEFIKHKSFTFDIHDMSERLNAPNIQYASTFFKKHDPKELFIAMNELCYQFTIKKDIVNTAFWIDWIIEFDFICQKKKKKLEGERRPHVPVQDKDQRDVIWIIWDMILYYAINNKLIYKIITELLTLFCIRYTKSIKRKRKYMIYHAIYLLIEPVNNTINICNNTDLIKKLCDKTGIIYSEIKKNEIKPNTDYLFMNQSSKSNIEKTLDRIQKMNDVLKSK